MQEALSDIIDPYAVQLEQRGRYSGFGGVLATVLFLSEWGGGGNSGAVDRSYPVSGSDVNGVDQTSFSFSKTGRPRSLLRTDFYELPLLLTFLRVINAEMAFPRV